MGVGVVLSSVECLTAVSNRINRNRPLHVMLLQCDLTAHPLINLLDKGNLPVAAPLHTTAHSSGFRHASCKWLLPCGHFHTIPHQLSQNDLIHKTSAEKSTRYRHYPDWQTNHQDNWRKVRYTVQAQEIKLD